MAEEASMFSAADLVGHGTSISHGLVVDNLPLPADFRWGAATAAYQVEGGAAQDGKGRSIWDTFTHRQPSKTNEENGDIACDHYNKMPQDVELMSRLGIEVYRFSIAWARVIPLGGRGDPINEEGLDFYSRLVDQLLDHNIQPVATLYHWDVPQCLYDRYGAMLNTEEFRADFEHYARLCFKYLGDRVKKWVTFNEPYISSIFAHHNGTLAPGHCRPAGNDTVTEPWRVGHTIILAHADAVKIYASEFQEAQRGEISVVLNGHFYEPWDVSSQADIETAERRMVFYIGWFGDPIFRGEDYPAVMREYLGSRLPKFSPEDRALLKESSRINAFYGMNHYSTKYARQLTEAPADDDWTSNVEELSTNSEGKEIGPASASAWLRIVPEGFRKLLSWVWKRYHLPIIITENGCPCPGETDVKTAIDDKFRQLYFGTYLDAISKAIYEDGVKVKGYYAWSLMDNFEWSAGYGPRFGIVHVDYTTLKRTPKNSAWYLKETFEKRRKAQKVCSEITGKV